MQRERSHRSPWIAAVLILSGCTVANQYTALREPPHTLVPRPPNEIEIFASSAPARPHVDVGLIYVRVLGGWDAQIRALREAAAEHGCDALSLNGGWGGACIVYVAPPRVVAPCLPATPVVKPEAVIVLQPAP